MRKIVIIGGLTAAIVTGILIGKAGGSSTATAAAPAPTVVTKTVEAPPAAPVTVTAAPGAPVTVTAPPPAPVTVTAAPAAPQATDDPAGPKKDGTYLVTTEIAAGNWKCDKADDFTFWTVHTNTNDIVDNGFSGIATVSADGFSAEFNGCNGLWSKVG